MEKGGIKMDFNWAKEMINKGNKVRRMNWNENSYIYVSNPLISNAKLMHSNGEPAFIGMSFFEAEDWELYEEFIDLDSEKRILIKQLKRTLKNINRYLE